MLTIDELEAEKTELTEAIEDMQRWLDANATAKGRDAVEDNLAAYVKQRWKVNCALHALTGAIG